MTMLYFSGTGNSKYIAELFCRNMNAACHSIEENIDFSSLIDAEDTIGFCYPIYGSRAPRILRKFAVKHSNALKNKKLIIFCTQLLFSGDGARSLIDLFPRNHFKVIYAEHFIMPNNVCNFFLLSLADDKKMQKYIQKAKKKMQIVCSNIKAGKIKKRGFNFASQVLGLSQGAAMPGIERKALGAVKVNNDCNLCGLCIELCPMRNLESKNGIITHKSNCTLCYRCINKCPQKAITVLFHEKVKRQYKGI